MTDLINRPPHYTSHPSGVECIQVTEHMNFCLGNAIKYIWRASLKGNQLDDLKKARWYIDREINRIADHGNEKGIPVGAVGRQEAERGAPVGRDASGAVSSARPLERGDLQDG